MNQTFAMHCRCNVVLLLLLFPLLGIEAQMPDTFGKVSVQEKKMTLYEKDPTAYAVVLYERGDNYFKIVDNRILLIKEYHSKIKLLSEKGFDVGTISISLRRSGTSAEKLTKIRAVTHNGENQYNVLPNEIFEKDINEYRSEKSFTFPKLQKGSILEYSYTITSPFIYNFRGWDFQTYIPKIYSEFNASIPGNYEYNRALIGSLKLDINEAKIQKECFHVDGFVNSADCEVVKYAMKDIPAFRAENDFMLSEQNYISRLDFELSQYHRFDGTTDKYTQSWEDVDKEFRSSADIGRQLTKSGYFEKNVPEKLLSEGDDLTRAKNIFAFIKDRFTWNGDYGIYDKTRVKEAFEEKKGNVSEINMSLINLLNAANIKANLLLMSTRSQGLPKKTHPVMSDFNYAVVKAEIDGKDYLLDATDKFNPFGMIPFRVLNHYGRVMDFNTESYWYDIKPEQENQYQIRALLKFNIEENKGEGIIDIVTLGYDAVDKNRALEEYSEENYLDALEKVMSGTLKITSYEFNKARSDEKKVSERIGFEMEKVLQDEMVYINPFFIRFFNENPFLMEDRTYPIDFGYPRNYKYQINISLPEGYQVEQLPEDQIVKLGENLAVLKFYHQQDGGQIGIFFDLALNNSYIAAEDYGALKNLFKHVTDIQKNSLVVLKKQ
jgi:hypothetical protein